VAVDPENPTDDSPLRVADDLERRGDAPFAIRPGALLHCGSCGSDSAAARQSADQARRTEGASDPADMTMVMPVVCPVCGARGTLTLGYGPEADPDASDFISAVPRDPRGSS
jgi:hypothetical protein